MNIKEYLQIIKSMSCGNKEYYKYYGSSSRGNWASTDTIIINTTPDEIFTQIPNQRLNDIAMQEVAIMDGGQDLLNLYKDDEELLSAYQSLKTNKPPKPSSRNNVWSNSKCCLMTLHVLPDNETLSIYQRSHDVKVAGKTDLLVAAILAKRWNCTKIQYIDVHPHVYLDQYGNISQEIRRRK